LSFIVVNTLIKLHALSSLFRHLHLHLHLHPTKLTNASSGTPQQEVTQGKGFGHSFGVFKHTIGRDQCPLCFRTEGTSSIHQTPSTHTPPQQQPPSPPIPTTTPLQQQQDTQAVALRSL